MEALRAKARALLEGGAVQVVVGYQPGSQATRVRPLFARQSAQLDALIFDDRCRQNLAVYLAKPEVRILGKAAVVARPATLRSILQYAAENQLADGQVLALAVNSTGEIAELGDFAAIEEYLRSAGGRVTAAEQQEIDALWALPRTERWKFWREQFSACVKCYACRAACPLCYCGRCLTDSNQPQWIPVASHELGNLGWHVGRAMHLAGRCVDCGSCADACPAGIRLDLLNKMLASAVLAEFGAAGGTSAKRAYALSTFKPDDHEDFIR